jgi:hypothetical protein
LPSGKVIVTGGVTTSTYLSSTEIYDPTLGTWSAGPALPGPRSGHAIVPTSTGIFIAGGNSDPNALTGTSYSLTEGGSFVAKASITADVWSNGAFGVSGDTVYLAKGVRSGSSDNANVWAYSLLNNSWTALAVSSTAATFQFDSGIIINGGLFVAGGASFVGASVSTVEFWYPGKLSLSSLSSITKLGTVFQSGGYVYYVGGFKNDSTVTSDVYRYYLG